MSIGLDFVVVENGYIDEAARKRAEALAQDGLVRIDGSGGTYFVRSGQRWAVPDEITASQLAISQERIPEFDRDLILSIPQAGILPTVDVSGFFFDETPEGDRSYYYLEHGAAFELDIDDLPATVRQFGTPAPLESAFPLGDFTNIIGQSRSLRATFDTDESVDSWLSIHEYLQSIPPPTITQPPGLRIVPISEPDPQNYVSEGGIGYVTHKQLMRISNVLNEFPVVAPVADAIWPGALVQGRSLSSGLLAPVQIDARSLGTIEISTELIARNPLADRARDIPKPTRAIVNKARRELLAGIDPVASTDGMTIDSFILKSQEQMSARLGVTLKGAAWNASADASVAGSLDKTTTVVKLEQSFYTVNFTPSGSPAQYFADDVTADELRVFSGPNNAPCYVSSITYGRIFILQIATSRSTSAVDAKVRAAWEAAVSGDVNLQAQRRTETSSYEVRVAAVGLSGETTFLALGGLVDTLVALKDTANYSLENPGAVISYTLRYLLDGTVAQAVIGPTEYTAYTRGEVQPESYFYTVWDNAVLGVDGGVATNAVIRPGDTVTISAFGSVNAGWWFGTSYGPAGDNTDRGREMGNGTKPLWGAPFTALLYGFGQGWFNWSRNSTFVCGENEQDGRRIGSDTTPMPLYLHINDDNVKNGSGAFMGTIYVVRRALAAVGPATQ